MPTLPKPNNSQPIDLRRETGTSNGMRDTASSPNADTSRAISQKSTIFCALLGMNRMGIPCRLTIGRKSSSATQRNEIPRITVLRLRLSSYAFQAIAKTSEKTMKPLKAHGTQTEDCIELRNTLHR